EVGGVGGLGLGVLGVAGREEHVLGGAESGPQRVVVLAGGAAGTLPLVHELAVGRGGRPPVGRVLQRLGARDQLLLDRLGALVLRVELGEVGASVAVEGAARLG